MGERRKGWVVELELKQRARRTLTPLTRRLGEAARQRRSKGVGGLVLVWMTRSVSRRLTMDRSFNELLCRATGALAPASCRRLFAHKCQKWQNFSTADVWLNASPSCCSLAMFPAALRSSRRRSRRQKLFDEGWNEIVSMTLVMPSHLYMRRPPSADSLLRKSTDVLTARRVVCAGVHFASADPPCAQSQHIVLTLLHARLSNQLLRCRAQPRRSCEVD